MQKMEDKATTTTEQKSNRGELLEQRLKDIVFRIRRAANIRLAGIPAVQDIAGNSESRELQHFKSQVLDCLKRSMKVEFLQYSTWKVVLRIRFDRHLMRRIMGGVLVPYSASSRVSNRPHLSYVPTLGHPPNDVRAYTADLTFNLTEDAAVYVESKFTIDSDRMFSRRNELPAFVSELEEAIRDDVQTALRDAITEGDESYMLQELELK